MTPEWISKIVAAIIIFLFWFYMGFLMAPFWFVITLIGALIGAFHWKEAPRIFFGLVMIKWWWDPEP